MIGPAIDAGRRVHPPQSPVGRVRWLPCLSNRQEKKSLPAPAGMIARRSEQKNQHRMKRLAAVRLQRL
jgi:hypothetical protein